MREERLLSSSSLSASSTCFLMSLAKRREATFAADPGIEDRDCSRPNALIREMYSSLLGADPGFQRPASRRPRAPRSVAALPPRVDSDRDRCPCGSGTIIQLTIGDLRRISFALSEYIFTLEAPILRRQLDAAGKLKPLKLVKARKRGAAQAPGGRTQPPRRRPKPSS
jgi:hypothetical protein